MTAIGGHGLLGIAIDWAVERGLLRYGPYDQLEVTGRAWHACVDVMAVLALLAAYVEGGTVPPA